MEDLEKYELVNKCETAEELSAAILAIANVAGGIQGRRKDFDADKMSKNVFLVINGQQIPNVLTRQYGIRQQALYIKYYESNGI